MVVINFQPSYLSTTYTNQIQFFFKVAEGRSQTMFTSHVMKHFIRTCDSRSLDSHMDRFQVKPRSLDSHLDRFQGDSRSILNEPNRIDPHTRTTLMTHHTIPGRACNYIERAKKLGQVLGQRARKLGQVLGQIQVKSRSTRS